MAATVNNLDFQTGDFTQWGTLSGILEYVGQGHNLNPAPTTRVTVFAKIEGATDADDILPPEGLSYFCRFLTKSGDVYQGSTGYRTLLRQHDPIPVRQTGFDSSWTYVLMLPGTYPGSGVSPYVAGWEIHHTGTTYTPAHFKPVSDRILVDVGGGAESNAVRKNNTILQDYTKGTWHVFTFRYKHGTTATGTNAGWFELWHGEQGVADSMTRLINLPNIATQFTGFGNYYLWGNYRDPSGSGDMVIYMTGNKEFIANSTTTGAEALDEALAYANGLLGSTGGGDPPPPPDPSPFDIEPANYLGGAYQITPRSMHGSQTNKQRCYKAVVQNTGTVSAMGTYREPQSNTGTETVKLAVWPDNGSGTDPGGGTPLGFTSELAFTSASVAGRYSANVTAPFGVSSGQIVWIGEISGGTANLAFTRAADSGLFRLMDATYTGGVVAWDTTTDAEYPLDLTTWMTGTLTTGQPPGSVVAPVITGSAVLGSTLTLSSVGTWSGPAPTFTYAWQTTNAAGSTLTDLNSHGTTYVTQPGDRGLFIDCQVKAVNAYGTTFAQSNRIGPITTVATRRSGTHRSGTRSGTGRRPGQGGGGG